jgi:hypothetical protein
MICFKNKYGETVFGQIFPSELDENNATFQCIIQSDNKHIGQFENSISNLSVGDEIAVKRGKKHLSKLAKYCDTISNLTIVTSSLGIAPTLQLIQFIKENGHFSNIRA